MKSFKEFSAELTVNESAQGFEPVIIKDSSLKQIEYMLSKIAINQSIRDVLGFENVYQNNVSIKDGKIVIEILAKPRK
jgi:hypothetical protein